MTSNIFLNHQDELIQESINRGEGEITAMGLACGQRTGRSP